MHDVVARLQVLEERSDRHAPAAPLGMARLAEAEDLGVGEDAQVELGDREAFGERDMEEHERARRGRLGDRLLRRAGDLALGEQLREPRGLRRRDDPRPGAGGGHLAQELVEPARIVRRARPAEPEGVVRRRDADRTVLTRLALQLGPGDVRRRKRRDRQAAGTQLLAPLVGHGLVRVPGECQLDGVLEHDGRRVRGQVREERRRRAQQRRERVDTRRVSTLPQPLEELRVVAERIGEHVPAGARDALGDLGPALERELARGEDDELLEGGLRALRHRIEGPDGLDVVAEQLDPRGLGRRRGVHVDDAAAPRERARLAHLGHRLVAERQQPRGGLLPRERRAEPERTAALREGLRGHRPLHGGAERCHDGERLSVAQPPEREEPLMHRARRRRSRFVRHRLALGERDDAILAEPAGDLRAPAPRPILITCHEQYRAPRGLDEGGPRVRARARGGIGHRDGATRPDPVGERVERRALLRSREQARETGSRQGRADSVSH